MPSLGADMEAGTLTAWKVQPGDVVRRGDIVAVVETEKANIDVEIFSDGTIERLLVQPGDKVPVGTVLATFRGAAEVGEPSPLRASPLARRLASERGVDLGTLTGTGPGGAVTQADVERAAQLPQRARQPSETAAIPASGRPEEGTAPLAGMRKAIALAMTRSNREIPHYFLETHIDMAPALGWLESQNQQRSVKDRLLPAVILIRSVALALQDVPELNAFWVDDRHELQRSIHVGFAIALRTGGLIAPAIHDANRKSVDRLMADLSDLVSRVRSNRLKSSELAEATITVTSLGDLGVETLFGVISPPQVALVGFGKIADRPWAESGLLTVRPVLCATLSGDHRATDGRVGARFLDRMSWYLRRPETL